MNRSIRAPARPEQDSRAVLMLVHPRRLHLYWIKDAALEEQIAGGGGPAEIRLEVSADGKGFEEAGKREFDFRAPGWYLDNDRLDCWIRARLGIRSGGGFRSLLISNAVRIPRERAGEAPELWRELKEIRSERATAEKTPLSVTSPGGRVPWILPRAEGASRASGEPLAEPERGFIAFVLHAHLPFVRHPEREFFLEEHWLFEAILETYLPLLDVFAQLVRERVPARVTMSLTPTLMAMLRDPVLTDKFARHLDRMCDLAGREVRRTRSDPDFSPAAGFYRDRLERYRALFNEELGRDLVGEFARLESEGILEIVACAATHGLLPELAVSPEAVRAQIAAGAAEHRRQIGRSPRGFWLPECAYFEGLDRFLAREGIEYFFVDTHAARNASRRPRLDLQAPLFCPAGVAAFARDTETTVQVWSSKEGYPGDPDYRDFYRDIGFDLDRKTIGEFLDPAGTRHMTGFKYHRITGATDAKEPYRRDWALRKVLLHAGDFLENRRRQAIALLRERDRPPLVTSMYDAELFGHWWFEGPEWLETVLRRLPEFGLRSISPGDYLDRFPSGQVAEPSTSSWGEGGYFEVWVNPATDWIYPPVHEAARRMTALASRRAESDLERRAVRQAGRELLLAQASDWPFILRNRTTVEYARRRVEEHLERFRRLAEQVESGRVDPSELARIESLDNLFPDLDPGIWRAA